MDDVLKLLQTFQGGTALQQQAPAAAASQPQEEKKREEEEEEDQSEAESEDNSAAAQFGQALGKKPAAKPAPKKEAKTPAKTAAPAGTGEASTPATFALDGRGQRFKDNLQRIASELLHKFVDASNTEKIPNPESSQEDKTAWSKKLKSVSSIAQSCAAQLKKVEVSPNKGGLEEQVQQLERLKEACVSFTALAQQLAKPNPNGTTILEALTTLDSNCPQISPTFPSSVLQKILAAQANLHLTFRKYEEYARVFSLEEKQAGFFV